MTFPKNRLVRLFSILLIILVTIFAFLNIYINIRLKEDLRDVLRELANPLGYNADFTHIGLDPLFNLRLLNLTIADQRNLSGSILHIDDLAIKPEVFSSLLSQKLHIREIVADGLLLDVRQQDIAKLIQEFNKIQDQRNKSDSSKSSRVGFDKIKIRNSEVLITPEHTLILKTLDLVFIEDNTGKLSEVRTVGEVSIWGNDTDVNGAIHLGSGHQQGNLEIRVAKLNVGQLPGNISLFDDVKLHGRIKFKIADIAESEGWFALLPINDAGSGLDTSLAFADYELNYDRSSGEVRVKKLNCGVKGLLKGALSGVIKNITEDPEFNLNGFAETEYGGNLLEVMMGERDSVLVGAMKFENLKLLGSRKNGGISLNGGLILSGLNMDLINHDLKFDNMNCDLKFEQNLYPETEYFLSSKGKCAVEEIYWEKMGILTDVSGLLGITSEGRWNVNHIALSQLTSGYMDGQLSGQVDLNFKGTDKTLNGYITGKNLNLEKTPRSVIPANMKGEVTMVKANFTSDFDIYSALISLTAENFSVRTNTGSDLSLSKVRSVDPFKLKYYSMEKSEIRAAPSNTESTQQLIITSTGLDYEGLSFNDYVINNGTVEDLVFNLDQDSTWGYRMSSIGNGFEVVGKDVELQNFSEQFIIENSGKNGYSGKIKGTGGRFKSIEFPQVAATYIYKDEVVTINEASAKVSTFGQFSTNNLNVRFGNIGEGYPYTVTFDDAVFQAFDKSIYSTGISGRLTIKSSNGTTVDWDGNVAIKKSDIFSQLLTDTTFELGPTHEGIDITDITGHLLGGSLTGSINIVTTHIPTMVRTNLSLGNATYTADGLKFRVDGANIHYFAAVPGNALPVGNGRVDFTNLNMENAGVNSYVNGGLNIETTAETLSVKDGFIRNKDGDQLRFNMKMENALADNRSLSVDFEQFTLASAANILAPLVPEQIRSGKIDGRADLNIEFDNLMSDKRTWSGSLRLDKGSFKGDISGTGLSLKQVDGRITLKDEGELENPLISFMGEDLKISKTVFQKFLRSFEQDKRDEGSDFLSIKEIEYGLLKFENFECELEVDREELNIKMLRTGFFRGELYGTGFMNFSSGNMDYNFSLLFHDISLEGISKRISSMKDYITGRVNGLIWLSGEGSNLSTIDGPFEFWAKKSNKEPKKIGKALLDKLGARERMLIGSTRSYDKGIISGYINDGIMTFKKINISNSTLGWKNLSIQVDTKMNSISISHFLSVIRELARRSNLSGPTIEKN